MCLPAQTIEDSADLRSLSVAAQRRTLLRAPAVMWFHSSTDGDGRLQRLRRGDLSAFNDWLVVSEMDRRSMMLMAGMAAVAAAIPFPEARAYPSRPDAPADRVPLPTAPPPDAAGVNYIFQDEFDGPSGSGPNPAKWIVQSWQDDVWPPVAGQYRDDRRNVFLDGNSNLVLLATQENGDYFSGKLRGNWRGPIGHTWEARIKLDCLTTGAWPSFWTVNEDPVPDGEVDIFEWYGNGSWPPEPRSTRHPTGKPGKGDRSPDWLTAGGTTGECCGTRTVSSSGGTMLTVRNRISVCRRSRYRSTADPATCGGRSTIPATL